MSNKRILISAATAALLVGCAKQAPMLTETGAPPEVQAQVETVSKSPAPMHYEATGTVKARLNAVLSSKVMARVVSVAAREGDVIRRGQTLISLDTRELNAGVQIAQANLNASRVGVSNARTARDMEAQTSAARIAQGEAAVQESKAALSAAQSRLDLALAGPRTQEKAQASLAVAQAESSLRLAKTRLDRAESLVAAGALAQKELDLARNGYEVALAQRDTAVQAEKIAQEGTREEDIRAAREGVAQAKAGVRQAEANLRQAKAAGLQTKVRSEEIRTAQAQVGQSSAALKSAQALMAYGSISAPFAGRVVQREADPGSMAMPGSPLMTVEGGELRLEATVPESVLKRLRKGQRLDVRIDALEQNLAGSVIEIVPQGDPTSHTFLVKVELEPVAGLHSGMFGRTLIPTGMEQSITIPAAAVWRREGLHYVYVVNQEGIARLRIVTVGKKQDGSVTILSGLKDGERIITEGRENVVDGAKVAGR